MILKKPYAFLIKNFKIIHLVLFFAISVITYMFGKVYGFFSDYNAGAIKVFENMAGEYISGKVYLLLVIVIVFSIIMLILMKQKKKPFTYYLALTIFYVVLLGMIIYAQNVIDSLYKVSLTQKSARGFRDIYLIASFPNYYFLAISLIRGIGFDIKKFNFSKDLEELEIDSKDNEEFEFVLGTDAYKSKRKARRIFRELKYYFIENKYMYIIIVGVIVAIIGLSTVLNIKILNKSYSVGQTLNASGISYKVNNAYLSQYDYNGKLISENKKYLIIDVSIKNNFSARALAPSNIYLTYGDNKNAYYKSSVGDYFGDLGKTYTGGVIEKGNTQRVLLVFEIPTSERKKSFTLNVLSGTSYLSDGKVEYEFAKFNINPKMLDVEASTIENKALTDELDLGKSVFKKSYLKINEVSFGNAYEYKYSLCEGSDCKNYYDVIKVDDSSSQMLMTMKYDMHLDEKAGINSSLVGYDPVKYVFTKFLLIEYTYNGKIHTRSLSVKTNSNIKNTLFADVPKNVKNSTDVKIIVKTRLKNYAIPVNTK